MSFSSGTGGLNSDINVTPMIDILLVLLITFMAITPVSPKGLNALVPQPPKKNTPEPPNDRTIVVSVMSRPGGGVPGYMINQDTVALGDLGSRLSAIFATRAEKVMFIKGDADLNYAQVAQVIDIGQEAGVDNIGLITPKVEAGQ